MPFSKIILASDFSKYSVTAARTAFEVGEKFGATVYLVHVLEKEPSIMVIKNLDLSEERILESIHEEAAGKLEQLAAELRQQTSCPIVPILRKGLDYQEIVNFAVEEKIDLIVLATHGRTGILHTLLGSVAEKVIRYASCPVLTITPNGEKTE